MKFPGKNAFKTLKTKFVLYSVLPLPTQRKRFFHQLHLKKKKKKEWLETLTLMQHPSKWLVCLNKVDVSLKVLSLMWSILILTAVHANRKNKQTNKKQVWSICKHFPYIFIKGVLAENKTNVVSFSRIMNK